MELSGGPGGGGVRMRRYLDAVGKINELRLLLNHPSHKNNTLLLLEGETDIRLFRSLLKHERITLDSVDGKLDLINVVESLKSDGFNTVIGICDADFDHIIGLSHSREEKSVYITDVHDAEMMMINSSAMQAFIDEYSNHENHQILSAEVKESAIIAACTLGLLRLANATNRLNLNFKGLNFKSFINIDKLSVSVDLGQLVQMLIRRSPSLAEGVTEDVLLNEHNRLVGERYQRAQLCCGHDVTNIIAMIYSQRWAACSSNINSEKVEQALRIGYSFEEFTATDLFQKIRRAIESFGLGIEIVNNRFQPTFGSLSLTSAAEA
jgi:hypothetical protein